MPLSSQFSIYACTILAILAAVCYGPGGVIKEDAGKLCIDGPDYLKLVEFVAGSVKDTLVYVPEYESDNWIHDAETYIRDNLPVITDEKYIEGIAADALDKYRNNYRNSQAVLAKSTDYKTFVTSIAKKASPITSLPDKEDKRKWTETVRKDIRTDFADVLKDQSFIDTLVNDAWNEASWPAQEAAAKADLDAAAQSIGTHVTYSPDQTLALWKMTATATARANGVSAGQIDSVLNKAYDVAVENHRMDSRPSDGASSAKTSCDLTLYKRVKNSLSDMAAKIGLKKKTKNRR